MERQRITGQIQAYSKKTREELIKLGEYVFKTAGIESVFREVYSCIDELVKNAVKANYKFILIIEYLEKKIKKTNPDFSDEKIRELVNLIVKNRSEYDREAEKILKTERLSGFVREILNEEAVQIRIKNKAYDAKRVYDDEEIGKLTDLKKINFIRKEMTDHNVNVFVKYDFDDEYIYVEVTNSSPILESDLRRIYEKRDEFRKCREEDRQQEFFLNNLDTSESGFGLGYATIDSYLTDLGLEPYSTIQIIAAADTTVILSLPILFLRERCAVNPSV